MMIKTKLFALLALCLGLGAAQAETLRYSVGGFSGGGTAQLEFTGTDTNADGALDWFGTGAAGNELSAFSLAFGGDALIPGFNFGLAELQRLHHGADMFMLQAQGMTVSLAGPLAVATSYVYDELNHTALGAAVAMPLAMAPVGSITQAAPVAAPVPEPQTAALWLAGLGAALFMGRRRRA